MAPSRCMWVPVLARNIHSLRLNSPLRNASATGPNHSRLRWCGPVRTSQDHGWAAHNSLDQQVFPANPQPSFAIVPTLQLTLVWLSLCLHHMLRLSDWLSSFPTGSRGSFFCSCSYCCQEIKVRSRGARLIVALKRKRKGVTGGDHDLLMCQRKQLDKIILSQLNWCLSDLKL